MKFAKVLSLAASDNGAESVRAMQTVNGTELTSNGVVESFNGRMAVLVAVAEAPGQGVESHHHGKLAPKPVGNVED